MTDRSDGYATHAEYDFGFHREMAPVNLRTLLLLKQRSLPDLAKPFRYLDLGCGNGFTTVLLAASNPAGEFIGVDFSSEHILKARDLAAAAGIGNVRFLEASFAEIVDDPGQIGSVDILACHAVYTWVSPENRRRVVDIMRRLVVAGGIVYLGYNAMPGWAPVAPLRELIKRGGETRPPGQESEAIRDALLIFDRLRAADVGYMAGNQPVARFLDLLGTEATPYHAHEFLPDAAGAIWHHEAARDLAAAGLDYLGSARLIENFDSMNIPRALHEQLEEAEAISLGEMLRDLAVNQTLRMDVFTRGAQSRSMEETDAAFGAMSVALAAPPALPATVEAASFSVRLPDAIAAPVLEIADAGPVTCAELLARAAEAGIEREQAMQVLVALIAGGTILPLAAAVPSAAAVAACRSFNRLAGERAAGGQTFPALASPVFGGGVALGPAEQAALAADEASGPVGPRLPYLRKLGVIDAAV